MKTELNDPLILSDRVKKPHCRSNPSNYINGALFGGVLGSLFFFTSLAGVSKIIDNHYAGIILGCITGIFDAITNGTLAMSATRDLFRVRPLLWGLTLLAFFTVGLPSALPFVAASMQSTDQISNVTGIDIRILKPIFGNVASVCYGVLNSMGIASLIVNTFSFVRAKWFASKPDQYAQMIRYFMDQRSVRECDNFSRNPTFEQFVSDKYSSINIVVLVFSLAAFLYDYSVSGELPKALNGTEEPLIAEAIGFGALIPISDYARTHVGSIVVVCLSAGSLHSTFVATSLRVMARDFKNSACNLREAGLTFLFLIGITLTAVTPIFEAIEGSGELGMSIISFFSALLINYSGPRPIFNRVFRKKSEELLLTSEATRQLDEQYPVAVRKFGITCCDSKRGEEKRGESLDF